MNKLKSIIWVLVSVLAVTAYSQAWAAHQRTAAGDIIVDVQDELGHSLTGATVELVLPGGGTDHTIGDIDTHVTKVDGGSEADGAGAADGDVEFLATTYTSYVSDGDPIQLIVSKSGYVTETINAFWSATDAPNATITSAMPYSVKVVVTRQAPISTALLGATAAVAGGLTVADVDDGTSNGSIYIAQTPLASAAVTVTASGFLTEVASAQAISAGAQAVYNVVMDYPFVITAVDELGDTTPLTTSDAFSCTGGTFVDDEVAASGNNLYVAGTGVCNNLVLDAQGYLSSTTTTGPYTYSAGGAQVSIDYGAGDGPALQYGFLVSATEEFAGAGITITTGNYTIATGSGLTLIRSKASGGNVYLAATGSGNVTLGVSGYVDKTMAGPFALNPAARVPVAVTNMLYSLKVIVYDELGTAQTATVEHGTLTPAADDGVNTYYLAATTTAALLVNNIAYVQVDSTTDSELGSIVVGSSNQTVVTIGANGSLYDTPCTGTHTAGTDISCSGLMFPLRVTALTETGLATNMTAIDTITYNTVAATHPVGTNKYYWSGTTSNAALVATEAGYVTLDNTIDPALADISVDPTVGRTDITLSGTTSPGASVAAGAAVTAKGLPYATKVTVANELGTAITGLAVSDITVSAANATEVSGSTLYYAQTAAGALAGGFTGYADINTGTETELVDVNPGTTAQTVVNLTGTTPCNADATIAAGDTTTCSGLYYRLKVTINDEYGTNLGNTLNTIQFNGTPASTTSGTEYYFAIEASGNLAVTRDGYKSLDVAVDTDMAGLNLLGAINGQTTVTLTGTTPCNGGATVPGANTCNGLAFNTSVTIQDEAAAGMAGLADANFIVTDVASSTQIMPLDIVDGGGGAYKLAVATAQSPAKLSIRNVTNYADSDAISCVPVVGGVNCGTIQLGKPIDSAVATAADGTLEAGGGEVITITVLDNTGAAITTGGDANETVTITITGGDATSTKDITATTCANTPDITGTQTTVNCQLAAGTASITVTDTIVGDGTDLTVAVDRTTGGSFPQAFAANANATVNIVAGAASQIALYDPTDGTIDGPEQLTAKTLDAYNNIATSDNASTFTITVDGSAVLSNATVGAINSGTGTNTIVAQVAAGIVTVDITDTASETVNIALTDTAATGYTLVGAAQDIKFSFGAVTQFVIVNPADGTVDGPVTVTVQAQDQFGNVNTNYNLSPAVTLNTDGAATGGGTVNIVSGVGTINIADTTAETVNLTLADSQGTALTVTSTQDVIFATGAVSQFVIVNPTDGTVDGPVAVTVQAKDQYGNLATAYTQAAAVTLNADGAATGDGAVNIVAGVGTMNIADTTMETVNLTLTDSAASGLTVTSTQDVIFAAGAVAKFVIIDPTDGNVGSSLPVTIQAQDQYGNLNTGYNLSPAVSLDADGSATGTGTVNIVAGVGTINITDTVFETVNLSLTDSQGTGFNVTSVQDIVYWPGAVTQFVIIDPVDGTVDAPITVTVQAQDQYGNVNISYNTDVTLNADGSATGDGLVNITAGVGTLNISDTTMETVNLTLTDSQATGKTVTSTQNVVFGAGAVTKFVIINPVDGTVDGPVAVTVQAQDQYNNVNSAYATDVTLATTGAATGGGVVDIVAGTGSLNISDTTPETITLSLVDSSATGLDVSSTQDLIFGVGAAFQFVILNPVDGTVDAPITVTVQAQDQYGNVDTSYAADVTLVADGAATGEGLVDIIAGVGTLALSDCTPETINLSLSDTQGTGLGVVSTQNVIFTAGNPTQFVITDPVDKTAGTATTVTVEAKDACGNIATGYNTDVTLVSTGSATGAGLVDIVAGTGSLSVNDLVAETVVLTLTDSLATGLTATSTQDVNFWPGPVTKFVIINPTDGTVDAAVPVTVQAQDANGNVNTAYNTDVTLNTSGAATGGGLVNIAAGVGTLNIADTTMETVNLTLTDSLATGKDITSTQDLIFGPGAAVSAVILNPVDGTVDAAIPVTLNALDQYGNISTSYSGAITLVSDGSATGAGALTFASGTVTANLSDQVAETVNLSLTGTALTAVSTQNVVFGVGAPTQFLISNPVDGTVDAAITVTVQATDQYGNVDTTYALDVTLNTSGSATGGGLVDIVAGVGTLNISNQVAETVNLTLADAGAGLAVASTQDVIFGAGAVTQFVVINPADGTVDAPINVTVQAQDQYGNVNTAYGTDVTVATDGSATGGGVVDIVAGVGTIAISDTVPETVNLTLADSSATGLAVASTQNVIFTFGAVAKFNLLDPVDGTVDAPISVTVQALDQFNNLNTAYGASPAVTVATSGSAVGGTVNIVAGVGTVNITDTVAETVALSLTDSQGTGFNVTATQSVIFGVGAPANFVIVNPADGTVDNPITVTVQTTDQYGNLDTTNALDVTLNTDGSATGGGLVDIVAGVGTIDISDMIPETVNLSLADAGAGLGVTSTQNVVFGPGAVADFILLDPVDGTVDAAIPVTVQAVDQFGNLSTGYTQAAAVTVTTTGAATGAGAVSIAAGVGTINISDTTPETVTLALSDTAGTGFALASTQSVVFGPGAASQFVIVNPTDGTVDAAITVTVQAKDQFGNIDTNYANDVTLVTNGTATGGGLVDIVAGVGTKNISDQKAETVALSLSDTQGTGRAVTSTQDVIFGAGAVTQFVIINPTDGTTAAPITVTVQAQDQYGNVNTAYANDVTLVTSGTATGGGLVDIVAGVGTLNISNTIAETVNLTLTDSQGTGKAVVSTQDVIFAPGPVAKISIDAPTNSTAGTAAAITVRTLDTSNNLAASDNATRFTLVASGSNAKFASSITTGTLVSGGGTSSAVVQVAGGLAVINLQDYVAESVTLSLLDSQGTGYTATSTQSVSFAVGAMADVMVLLPGQGTAPTAGQLTTVAKATATGQTAGTSFSVKVYAVDQYSNIVTSITDTVSLTSNDTLATSLSSFALVGGAASQAVTLKSAGSIVITATDASKSMTDTSTVAVTANTAPTELAITPGASITPTTSTTVTCVLCGPLVLPSTLDSWTQYVTIINSITIPVLSFPYTSTSVLNQVMADNTTEVPIVVTIVDEFGNKVVGQTVTLVLISSAARTADASADRSAAALSGTGSATTDANGQAVFKVKASTAGTYTFKVVYGTASSSSTIGVSSFTIAFSAADTAPPAITISPVNSTSAVSSANIADGDVFMVGETITMKYKITDEAAIDPASLSMTVTRTGSRVGSSRVANAAGTCTNTTATNTQLEGACTWSSAGSTAGTYTVTLSVTDIGGNVVTKTVTVKLVSGVDISQVYAMPNPLVMTSAADETKITFQSTAAGVATVDIYSTTGRLIYTVSKAVTAGYNEIPWTGRDMSGNLVASDVYFFRVTGTAGGQEIKGKGKVAVIKKF